MTGKVTCDEHDNPGGGYVACTHVVYGGAAIAHLLDCGRSGNHLDDLGEALCQQCLDFQPAVDGLMLVCARCMERIFAQRGTRG